MTEINPVNQTETLDALLTRIELFGSDIALNRSGVDGAISMYGHRLIHAAETRNLMLARRVLLEIEVNRLTRVAIRRLARSYFDAVSRYVV